MRCHDQYSRQVNTYPVVPRERRVEDLTLGTILPIKGTVGNLTWPIVVSLLGLLVPQLVSFLQQAGDRSALRQLERLSALDLKDSVPVALTATRSAKRALKSTVAASRSIESAVKDLQLDLIDELRARLKADLIRKAFVQSLLYFLFVSLGTFASGYAVAQATSLANMVPLILVVIAGGLLVLNLIALCIAGSFVAKSAAALFPDFDRELHLPWRKKGAKPSVTSAAS